MYLLPKFKPMISTALRAYTVKKFTSDVFAGITVGIIALPLAIAFAIASGMRPEAGVYTAIIGGFLVSAFGGSTVQIGGPAGAFIVIVYGVIEQYGVLNLQLATMLAGVILLVMGIFKVGALIRHIPVSIVIGFTNGIAILIGLSQIKDFLGLPGNEAPAEFISKIQYIIANINNLNTQAVFVGVSCLFAIMLWPKSNVLHTRKIVSIMSRVPGTIVAVVIGVVMVRYLHLNIETIGTKFGGIPHTLPSITMPYTGWQNVRNIIPPAITIALLCSIESLLCARVADSLTGEKHDSSQELIGQGIANFVVPLFGGFCVTGAIARTVANIRSGAITPVSGIVHSLTLLFIVLVAAPLASDIPMASLAAILLFVSYNMGEWRKFLEMRSYSNNYKVILLAVFILTVTVDLSIAVEIGLVLSCIFFITRISSLTNLDIRDFCGGTVSVVRIRGSLFFGSVDKLDAVAEIDTDRVKVMIIDLSELLNIDTTGLEALENIHARMAKIGGNMILCCAPPQAMSLFRRSGFDIKLGHNNIYSTLNEAVSYSFDLVSDPPAIPIHS